MILFYNNGVSPSTLQNRHGSYACSWKGLFVFCPSLQPLCPTPILAPNARRFFLPLTPCRTKRETSISPFPCRRLPPSPQPRDGGGSSCHGPPPSPQTRGEWGSLLFCNLQPPPSFQTCEKDGFSICSPTTPLAQSQGRCLFF